VNFLFKKLESSQERALTAFKTPTTFLVIVLRHQKYFIY